MRYRKTWLWWCVALLLMAVCGLSAAAPTTTTSSAAPIDEQVTMTFGRFEGLLRDARELKLELERVQQAHRTQLASIAAAEAAASSSRALAGLPDALRSGNGRIVHDSRVEVNVSADYREAIAVHRMSIDFLNVDARAEQRWHTIELVSDTHVVPWRRIVSSSKQPPPHFFTLIGDALCLVVATNSSQSESIDVEFAVFHHIGKQAKTHALALQARQQFESFSLNFVNRSLVGDIQVSPRAFLSERAPSSSTQAAVDVRTMLTTTAEVTWRTDGGASFPSAVNASTTMAAQMTASIDALFSISESVQGVVNIAFAIDSDASTVDELSVALYGDALRVTSVAGLSIDQWSMIHIQTDAGVLQPTLRVKLQQPIARDVYTLTLRLEQNVVGDVFSLPVIVPLNTIRNAGRIFVTSSKNAIEVMEDRAAGVAVISEREFSEELKMVSNRPPLLCYSFVSSDYDVRVRRKLHSMMDQVVVSFMDTLHETIHVAERYSMHVVRGVLRNTRQQFLTMRLPASLIAIWSVAVNSDAVSPSTYAGTSGESNERIISIPLLSTLRRVDESDFSSRSTFDLVFLTANDVPLNASGLWSVTLAQPDVPVTVHESSIRFPVSYWINSSSSTMNHANRILSPPQRVQSHRMASEIVNFNKRAGNTQYNQQILEEIVSEFPSVDIELPSERMTLVSFYRELVQPWDRSVINIEFEDKDDRRRKAMERNDELWAHALAALVTLLVCLLTTVGCLCRRRRAAQQTSTSSSIAITTATTTTTLATDPPATETKSS